MHRGRRLVAALVLLWMMHPSSVLAHAVLIGSDPANGRVFQRAPTAVHLLFSESVQPIAGGIIVVSPSGRRVSLDVARRHGTRLDVSVRSNERGSYLVIWHVISGDTHPSRGQFIYSVGHVSPTVISGNASSMGLTLQVISRWLHYIGFALGFGPLLFALFVLRPLRLPGLQPVYRRLYRFVGFGIIGLLLAEPLALAGQTSSLGTGLGIDTNLAADVLASSFGRVLAQRLAVALLLWALLGAVDDFPIETSWAAVVLGLALAFVDGEASHAVSASPAWIGLLSNAVHVAAMVVWVGGLASLVAVWRLPALNTWKKEVVTRFGLMAATCVGLLGVSGAIMAVQHLRAPTNLWDASYGRALVAKQVVFLVALLVVFRSLHGELNDRRRWWLVELSALAGILALAGLMVSLPPPG